MLSAMLRPAAALTLFQGTLSISLTLLGIVPVIGGVGDEYTCLDGDIMRECGVGQKLLSFLEALLIVAFFVEVARFVEPLSL